MPITKMLCVLLPTGFGAWFGWSLGSPFGTLPGFLVANLGFAIGWYLGRSYVRNLME